jgi:hypothetical protein
MLMGEVRAEGLLRAIDPVVRAGLSLKQEDAIRAAARQDAWQAHPIDIRLVLPSPFGRIYLALVGGPERRSAARLAVERARHPLSGSANRALVGAAAVILVLAGIGLYGLLAGAMLP